VRCHSEKYRIILLIKLIKIIRFVATCEVSRARCRRAFNSIRLPSENPLPCAQNSENVSAGIFFVYGFFLDEVRRSRYQVCICYHSEIPTKWIHDPRRSYRYQIRLYCADGGENATDLSSELRATVVVLN